MIMCKIMVKPISCKPFERLSYDKYDVWNVWNAFARRVLDSERENESERGKKVRKRGWESTRKARARSIKKKEIKGHFVVRSVNECESDETIAMRTWFVVFEHVIRQPASSISGHRWREEFGIFRSQIKKRMWSWNCRRRSTLAGWRTFWRFFEVGTLFCWRLIVVKMVVRYITIWSMLTIRKDEPNERRGAISWRTWRERGGGDFNVQDR